MKIKWLNFKWFKKKDNKNTITIKKNWNEVTLKEYFEIVDILTDEKLDEMEKNELIILTLTSIDAKTLSQVNQTDYVNLLKSIKFISEEPKKVTVKDCLTINGKQFDVDIKLDKVVAGQYMMLQNIMKLEGYEDRIKKSIAVFIRPKDHKWGDFDYDENVEYLYNNISIVDALSLASFFFYYPKTIVKKFPNLYEKRDDDGEEEIEEETPVTFTSQWGIMVYVNMCCEITMETIPNILKSMSIVDMMFYCSYAVAKAQDEKKKLEEYKRKNK